MRSFLKIITYLVFLTGCIPTTINDNNVSRFDSRKIKLQFFSFFNQRDAPIKSESSWKGDWIFRRERLNLIEKELGDNKPDLNIFQNSIGRENNPYESDLGILGSSVLKSYKSHLHNLVEYEDTHEIESHAVSIIPPLYFCSQEGGLLSQENNHLSWDTLTFEKEPVLVVNMELKNTVIESILNEFLDEIKKIVSNEKICNRRIILAASIPPEIYKSALRVPDSLNLQDASKNFCITESDCYTANSLNEIFSKAYGEILPSRYDFIFVPTSAKVILHKVNFKDPARLESGAFRTYGMKSLWASDRFGIRIDLLLAKCT